jgi:D-aminoacyl-tRNA deacylase
MRAVVQRVSQSTVTIGGKMKSKISKGLLILLGIENKDDIEDVDWLGEKICLLRIFDDSDGVMNLSVMDAGGEIMIISQFTLFAKTRKGNRPSYINAANPEKAIPMYHAFVDKIESFTGRKAATGEFGAMMEVLLVNDGPVTIIIDTKNRE